MSQKELIKEWESGLWKLENGVASIAEHAAEMAVNYPGCSHDGVGKMIESNYQKPDYAANPEQVIAIITDDETESEAISQGEWQEHDQQPVPA